MPKGHKAFNKTTATYELSTESASLWDARGEALASKHEHRAAPSHIRRVSRAQETSDRAVAWAIPQGSVKASHSSQTWRACIGLDELQSKRADRRMNTLRVLWVLLRYTDFTSMTVRITWDTIAQKAQVSRSTVGAILFDLRSWGLLGIVASGRSAEFAAKAGQEAKNEAPVYVVCRPVGIGLRPTDRTDTTPAAAQQETPATTSCGNKLEPLRVAGFLVLKEKLPTRAREEKTLEGTASRPEIIQGRASSASGHQIAHQPELTWPSTKKAASKKQFLAASSELRHQIFLLRPMTVKDLRSVIRPFLEAGWTIHDLKKALDFMPDGTPWDMSVPEVTGNDRLTAVIRLRGWLKNRLGVWMRNGQPMRSPLQRTEAETSHRRAEAHSAAQRAQARRNSPTATHSPAATKCISDIRRSIQEARHEHKNR
uniref:hypothetical protein n=1 Tax=Arthrobacter sp. TaxID=1667 RepID=UPI00159EEBF1|nr:hypothetical protein [Arthrobacter sp.]